ncbi:hypothetical protein [Subtercola sp. YIM 133946]|uniref:hypothetical protein n=1 Tax=Subtercola sp. YIM 133946 TaxID=3118909 RepID=UPI002F93DA4C
MRRVFAVCAIAVVGTSLFSGCAIANVVSPPFAAAIYASPADAAGAASNVALPAWVPADAVNIRIKTDETKNASIMMFQATNTAPTFTGCDAASDPDVKTDATAALNETWWPQAMNDGVGVVCNGPWHLFAQDGFYYAWTP